MDLYSELDNIFFFWTILQSNAVHSLFSYRASFKPQYLASVLELLSYKDQGPLSSKKLI